MISPASFNYYQEELDNMDNVTGLLPMSERILQGFYNYLSCEPILDDLLDTFKEEGYYD